MIHSDENNWQYYQSVEEAKQDGLNPIKVWNVLQFFTLAGKKTILSKYNMIPIPDVKYMVLNGKDKYYVKTFAGWDIDALYFYRPTITFSGEDVSVKNLRRYVSDGRCYLLFTPANVKQTKEMLARVYKAQFSQEGTLPYKLFIQILEENLQLEDYQNYGKNLIGHKTACKIMLDHIGELWKEVSNIQKQ